LNQDYKRQVEACEEQLKQAMLTSNVSALDKLLAPDLVFTNHLGQTMTRQDDLEMHKSGTLQIKKILLTNQNIKKLLKRSLLLLSRHLLSVFLRVRNLKITFGLPVSGVNPKVKAGKSYPGIQAW